MKNIHSPDFKIGLLGGGQLGRMTLQEAYNLNLHISVLDPASNAPCKPLAYDFVCGDFKDFDTVYHFGKDKDVLTIEFEDVNADALEKLEKEGIKVFPQPAVLKLIQDKGEQKQFYKKHDIPTAEFVLVDGKSEIAEAPFSFPCFQKLRRSGYDGYGVQKLKNESDLDKAFAAPSVLERLVDMEKEISVIVARNEDGQTVHFPPVAMEFNPKANMVEFLYSPAGLSKDHEKEAIKLGRTVIEKLNMVGILAVEMFLTKEGKLLVNEIAPRAHNSGHQSIEGNYTSQFAQHLRAILNLPLGDASIKMPSVMINLLGKEGEAGVAEYVGLREVLAQRGVYPHFYGKEKVKSFRKMGHITITHPELEEAKKLARKIKEKVTVIARAHE
jgi:5-(carboxyamino)imidazole ribonucleotide synthase